MVGCDNSVIAERRGAVLRLTIDRPERRNALNGLVFRALEEKLLEADESPDIRAVVLTGAGDKAFSAGADLKPDTQYTALTLDEGALEHPYASFARAVRRFGKPLIARVNGDALAGGLGVLSLCDMAVAADHARFGLPEVRIGLFPMFIVATLRRLIPRRRLMEMAITGEFFDAAAALEMGLVNYVVPAGELDAKCDWLAARILDKSPTAVRRGKAAMGRMWEMTEDDALAYGQAELALLFATADHAEGLAAFNEKRKPAWPGGGGSGG
jgi:enoyl-CoA hydratase/carnithine racemase